jgi:hypothetical protein
MTNSKKIFVETLKAWTPLAVAIIVLSFIAYVLVQQNYRMTSNDPQIQIAEDISDSIGQGTPPDSIVPPTGTTEISKSLAVFVMIFDDSDKMLGSSAILDGKNPNFPTSVLDGVKKSGKEARITWQPEAGVRMAVDVVRYQTSDGKTSGYVVAGRSLRETEVRENNILLMASLGALFTLVVTFLITWLFKKMEYPEMPTTEEETVVVITEEKSPIK